MEYHGASKLVGDWLARDAPRHYVLRVESLFGGNVSEVGGVKFVAEMLNQVDRGAEKNILATGHFDDIETECRIVGGKAILQFKLVDASGENVWWHRKADYIPPREWQDIRIKRRQIEFAWGPTTDKTLRRAAAIEFVVVDPVRGTRERAFDHGRLAAALSVAAETTYVSATLPFERIRAVHRVDDGLAVFDAGADVARRGVRH